MPAYLDEKTKTYYFTCYYTDWQGERRRKMQRGFTRMKDAKAAERQFLDQYSTQADMSFETLYQIYIDDCRKNLKAVTVYSRDSVAKNAILPYFGAMKVTDITPAHIRKWQNDLKEHFAPTTQRQRHTVLSAIFNFAVKFYGLRQNPAKLAGGIGSLKSNRQDFWTLEEFNAVIKNESDITYKAAYVLLFYSGLRIGELLALTLADYDREAHTINIDKTLSRIGGVDHITPPKTPKAIRKIVLPAKATAVLDEYIGRLYEPQPEERLFYAFGGQGILKHFHNLAKKAGVPPIRLHDLRHSHASLLINAGVNVKAISERLGHEDIQTTLNIYGHLYEEQASNIAEMLDKL